MEHVVVEGNYICGAGTDDNYAATGVMVTTEAPETPGHINSNILIRNNHIEGRHRTAIRIDDAKNVEIYGNTFVWGHDIVQRNCRDVKIGKNIFK